MSLIAHCPLNGNAVDLLSNHNGSPSGAITWTDGKIGQCAEFNGINTTISFGTGVNIFPLPEFSMSIWFNSYGTTATTGTSPGLFGFTYGIRLLIRSNYLTFFLDNGTTFIGLSSPSTYDFYNSDKWHHVIVAADAGNMYMFIDGDLVASRTTTWSGTTRWPTNSAVLGRDNNNSNYYFRGLMDDFRIYNHVLSEREARDIAKGIVVNYSFDRETTTTENIAYTSAGNHDLTWSNLSASVSVTDLISNQKVKVESTTGGSFRVRFDHTRLTDGQPYNFSFKYSLVDGTSFNASDWCDTAFNNITDTGSSFSAWGVRSDYNATYCFVDFNISANSIVHIWDIQLEQRKFPTKFVAGSRTGIISDNSGNGTDIVLSSNCPEWVKPPIAKGGYRFNGTDNALTVPNSPTVLGSTSIAFWLFPTNASRRQTIWNKGYGGEGTINFESTSGFLRFYSGPNGNNNAGYQSLSSSVLPLNEWTHAVVTREMPSGAVKWYLNGELNNTGSFSFTTIGETTFDLTIGSGYTSGFEGSLSQVKQYATVLNADEVKAEYQTGLAVDDHHRMHIAYLNESGIINPNFLDYTTWTVGTTGSETGFGRNGTDSENFRILDIDPFGKQVVVWEARPDAVSGADGGWNGSYYPVDNTKLHRVSVWIRRTVKGNGSYYLGTNGGGSVVLNRSNGAANGNPYFSAGGWGAADGQWRLFVGHVWPVGSGTGASHEDSGIYENGIKLASATDFVCASGTTSLRHRSYLYYSTDTTTRQQFVYPRIDVCDGTEPSIEALIAGFDSLNYERTHDELGSTSVPDNLGVKRRHTDVGLFSELGITRGMVSYFPLKGDAKDRVSNEVATVTGAVPTADGYDFDGVDDQIDLGSNITFSTDKWSVSGTFNTNDASLIQNFFGTSGYVANLNWCSIYQNTLALWIHQSSDPNRGWHFANTVLSSNTEYHFCLTYDGAGNYTYYLNGVVDSNFPTFNTELDDCIIRYIGTYEGLRYFDGVLSNMKAFDKLLTPEEVAQEYESSSKSMINNSTAFAKEFIEV